MIRKDILLPDIGRLKETKKAKKKCHALLSNADIFFMCGAGRLIREGKREYVYRGFDKVAEVIDDGRRVAEFTYGISSQMIYPQDTVLGKFARFFLFNPI